MEPPLLLKIRGERHGQRELLRGMGGVSPAGDCIAVNNYHLEWNGRPWLPSMGEFHYARYPARYWEEELRKIRAGGVEVVASYVFWIHHEEEEGVFDWSGDRDLRRFVQLCADVGLWMFPRIGPFNHGDVRNGGLPDWLYGYPFPVRSNDQRYLQYVERFFQEIGRQLRGLMFREGGPVIGVQIENEFMDSAAPWECTQNPGMEYTPVGSGGREHMMHLKRLAMEAGIEAPIWTATGWGSAPIWPEQFVPVFGGYAFYSWIDDPTTQEPTGNYVFRKAHGREHPRFDSTSVPYACCELGAGMQVYYRNRPIVPAGSVEAMHVVQLGCGGNLMGYYEYHGGSNPEGKRGWLNEYRDPQISNDYQACLREFGQTHESYHRLRRQFLFLQEWGARLAPMETFLPEESTNDPRDTKALRWAVRANETGGFVFLNNYQDHVTLPERSGIWLRVETAGEMVQMPLEGTLTIGSGMCGIMPFQLDLDGVLLKSATVQPLARVEVGDVAHYFFFALPGIAAEFVFDTEVEVTGGLTGASSSGDLQRVEIEPGCDDLLQLRGGNGQEVAIGVLTNEESLRAWKGRFCGCERLVIAECDLFFVNDQLELRPGGAEQSRLRIFPPVSGGLACEGKVLRAQKVGGFEEYVIDHPMTREIATVERVTDREAMVRFTPDALEEFSDAYVLIECVGDVGEAFIRGRLVHDYFCNGMTWVIGVKRFAPAILEHGLYLRLTPLRSGGPKVEFTEMAAIRPGELEQGVAEIRSIQVMPERSLRVASACT
jgi:beta-galactosidase